MMDFIGMGIMAIAAAAWIMVRGYIESRREEMWWIDRRDNVEVKIYWDEYEKWRRMSWNMNRNRELEELRNRK